VKKLGDKDLMSLVDLYIEAGQPELTKAVVDRALSSKTLSAADRPGMLVYAVRTGLKETKTAERNARLERYVAELDRSAVATLDQKLEAHVLMNGWYRYDDVDSGIIKHSTWIIEASKKFTPAQRPKSGPAAVSAYVNLAQALAGQGMNDQALSLLATAKTELADVPNVARSVDPEIARLKMVGMPGAAITARRWLNMPAGKTDLPMPGSVTLLEFSAHWCVPCKESYPGVNRLLAKYGPRGFRVVLATQYYGYFEAERNITPEVEFERSRKYYAEHGMKVPIAVADKPATGPTPNAMNYQVGGIPQIHLVDKQGRIRLVMVGYDDANEPKLAKMIEDLLKE
jgi:thiol-disulfide isomerase/thioredoxin